MAHQHQDGTRNRRAVVFFAAGLVAFVAVTRFQKIFGSWAAVIEEAVTTLAVVALVHLLDRIWLFEDVKEELNRITKEVHAEIGKTSSQVADSVATLTQQVNDRVDGLTNASLSLAAMNQAGILRVYASRSEADEDIENDLVRGNPKQIRLIGISLNDFVRGQINKPLERAWREIERRIQNPKDNVSELDIKVLIIDPVCNGAELRSRAEHRGGGAPDRLKDHVKLAVERLLGLMKESKENLKVQFECKMYRLPPQLFLCLTDNACYVQPYHFWDKRHDDTPIPVLRYGCVKDTSASQAYDMHTQMLRHFDWIWDKASISLEDFYNRSVVGIERGMSQCRAVNVYTDSDEAWQRIQYLVQNAQKRIDIQGISLHSYFRRDDVTESQHPFRNLLDQGKVEIRVLLLDLDSEQAKYRSYREYLLRNGPKPFAAYTQEEHRMSHLFRDTEESIDAIKWMVADVAESKKKERSDWKPLIRVKKYSSAPVAFVLRIDSTILVEQYQYGKKVAYREVLGRDMPLMEFIEPEPSSGLIEPDIKRSPYYLLQDHFNFAWDTAEEVPLSQTSSTP